MYGVEPQNKRKDINENIDENGKRRKISAKTLEKLEKRVKDRNLEWIKFEDN